jgi:uncharacterized protein (TIGR03435 family)
VGLLQAVLGAQTASVERFEVVSIKPSAPLDRSSAATPRLWGVAGGRVTLMHIPLRYVLLHAFDLRDAELVGPGWIDSSFFDILATVPREAQASDITVMFQNMLADRFNLKCHLAPRGSEVYALKVAPGGSKLKEVPALPSDPDSTGGRMHSSGSGSANTSVIEANGPLGPFTVTFARDFHTRIFTFASLTMPNLAQFLTQLAELPVVDATALRASYQLRLECAALKPVPDAADLSAGEPGPDFMCTDSLKNVGLLLKREKLELKKLIVDHIERPTPN